MTRLKASDDSCLRMIDSKNKPIGYSGNNPFEDDGKNVLEIVVDVSIDRMHFII